MRALLLLVLSALLLFSTSARKVREDTSKFLDAHEVIDATNTNVAIKGSLRSFFCGMFHLTFAGSIELAVGASVDITLKKDEENKWTIAVAGMFGGGFTVSVAHAWSLSVQAQHQVEYEAKLPNSVSAARNFNPYSALKWAMVEWFNSYKQKSPTPRFVNLEAGKIENIVRMRGMLEHNLQKEYKLSNFHATNQNIVRDNIDGILNFATEFEHFLKTSKPRTEEAYINGMKRAFWASHVNHACALTDETKFKFNLRHVGSTSCDGKACDKRNGCKFTLEPSHGHMGGYLFGLGKTDGPPDCETIHKFVGVAEPGYFNLLCVFMTSATLLQGKQPDHRGYDKKLDGIIGMENMLDMIPIIFGKSVSGEQESVGLFPQAGGRLDFTTILAEEGSELKWIKSLELGKWKYPADSKILLRGLGSILATDSYHLEPKLQTMTNDHAQPNPALECPPNSDPSTCGINKYKVMTTGGVTTGFGGSINFCTPDTNAVQLYLGYEKEYTLQGSQVGAIKKHHWIMTDRKWTSKVTFAGQTYFQIDITRYSSPAEGVIWEPLVRITVPGEWEVPSESADSLTDPPPELQPDHAGDRQAAVDAFVTDQIVPFIGKLASAMSKVFTGALHLKAAYQELQNEFQGSLKNAGKKSRFRSERRLTARTSPQDVMHSLTFETVLQQIARTVFPPVSGLKALEQLLGQVAERLSPVTVKHTWQVGVEFGCQLKKQGGSWKMTNVLTNMFFLQFRSFEANTAPWAGLAGGADVKIGGYIGTEAKFELDYTRKNTQVVDVQDAQQ